MSQHLHAANDAEAERLWPVVKMAHLFDDPDSFATFRNGGPWRVLAGPGGVGALVERWRDHLDILAVRGLWCSPRDIPDTIEEIVRVAREQGFGRVLSPLVPKEFTGPYERSGMQLAQSIIAIRNDVRDVAGEVRPESVLLRSGLPEDVPAVLAVDHGSFDEFWQYGLEQLAEHLLRDRVVLAEVNAQVIGYTHCTVERGAVTLGRLAVLPAHRRTGVGSALLSDVMLYAGRAGARHVDLCTQEENDASRALYQRAGMRELHGRLAFLMRTIDPAKNGGE